MEPSRKKLKVTDILPVVAGEGQRISAIDAIVFHPVNTVAELSEPPISYKPLYTHQFFGQKEEISGLRELLVEIFYTPDTFRTYVRLRTAEDDSEESKSKVIEALNSRLCANSCNSLITDEEKFVELLSGKERAQFRPPGKLKKICDSVKVYDNPVELYDADFLTCNFGRGEDAAEESAVEFKQYHRRVEWLLTFFIEACSAIEQDDRWRLLLGYGKNAHGFWELLGLTTLYTFFSVPLLRRRVSQFLILQPYQASGLGTLLLKEVYKDALAEAEVGEITIEDPGPAFCQLRDLVGLLICLESDGLIEAKDFFPTKIGKTETCDAEAEAELLNKSIPTHAKLRALTKESHAQRSRLRDIFALCRLLPEDLCPPAEDSSDLETRGWRRTNSQSSEAAAFTALTTPPAESEAFGVLRRCIKRRLMERGEISTEGEVKAELEKQWRKIYGAYYRVIAKVRSTCSKVQGRAG